MTVFHPASRIVLRIAIFCALGAFGLVGTASPTNKVIWLTALSFLFGSFRMARINGDQFERRFVLMFVPQPWKRWPMERFVAIETRYADESAISTILPIVVLNIWLIVWSAAFDWLIPWLGGGYELRLRSVKGGHVLVWKGNSDANFQANLVLLETATGLPIHRK